MLINGAAINGVVINGVDYNVSPTTGSISTRCALSYGDANWPYVDIIESRAMLTYDLLPALQLSARTALLYAEAVQLISRVEFTYNLYALNVSGCALIYDLDENDNINTRSDLSYSLAPEVPGQVQSGSFTLRTKHG